ncbi:hypothetical protein Pmar_PMAR000403 [Perkinsus marinus ATCC 50983]|uniref:Uncharacterized protein n=1 Tax=Perkinsus marinus (strain ATCC 50983 / TXsc) TaxID=423536 RepID=C5L4C7_PERM5|nr:hypothetical protein Pmar_PMAR000403 [Perkinsus marinus ATCC 50983]EER08363.1 hypothetical protein Pmar_PMAR000403 [Perkinsus marinus ATCC 50983]|eukprot:XP_002776547.1 hypothetical protein Pmar_PMAR000403 [Perkinsus marinus ATCC 50983]
MPTKNPGPSRTTTSSSSCKLHSYCRLRFWLTFALVPILSILFYGIAAFYVSSRPLNAEGVKNAVDQARQVCRLDGTKPTCREDKRYELEMNRVYPSEYGLASLQQHKARNVFNECPRGHYLVPVSESDAGRGFFRQSLYVDPEDDCRLWELEPVRTSLFHDPYELLKMTSLNPDCSSAEIEVNADAMLDSGVIQVNNQSRLGSFNYMDPWISPIQHFTYDVLPCALYAISKEPETVPRRTCVSSVYRQQQEGGELTMQEILSS